MFYFGNFCVSTSSKIAQKPVNQVKSSPPPPQPKWFWLLSNSQRLQIFVLNVIYSSVLSFRKIVNQKVYIRQKISDFYGNKSYENIFQSWPQQVRSFLLSDSKQKNWRGFSRIGSDDWKIVHCFKVNTIG